MRAWLKKWTPASVAAARAMQPIWSQPGEKVIRFEESLEHSRRRFSEVLDGLNLDTKELEI
jgi:propane monooxygenase small subunit